MAAIVTGSSCRLCRCCRSSSSRGDRRWRTWLIGRIWRDAVAYLSWNRLVYSPRQGLRWGRDFQTSRPMCSTVGPSIQNWTRSASIANQRCWRRSGTTSSSFVATSASQWGQWGLNSIIFVDSLNCRNVAFEQWSFAPTAKFEVRTLTHELGFLDVSNCVKN